MLKGKYLAGMLALYLVIFVSCFYLSIPLPLHLLMTLGGIGLFFLSLFVKKRKIRFEKRRLPVFLLAAVLLFGAFGYGAGFVRTKINPALSYADGKTHTAVAVVEEIHYEKAYASSYRLQMQDVDGETCTVGAILEIPFAGSLSVGDTVTFEGIFTELTDEYAYYQRSRGILLSASTDDFDVTMGKTPKASVFERLREAIAENFETHIGGKEAGYAKALLIGVRDELDGGTSLSYQRLGISHVLAVSGMHFSVIVGGLDLFLRALTVSKRKKNIILIVFSLIFAAICGFSASIARAFIMFCIYYIADSIGEKSDSLTSLFFAASCIVTVNPWAVYDAGLWLSVFSTLGILLVVPSLNRMIRRKKDGNLVCRIGRKCLHAFLTTTVMNFTALFFTMPIVYALYGGISLLSPIANLIFIPLTSLILYLLIFLTIFGFVPILAPFLGMLSKELILFSDNIAKTLSDMRGIYVSIRYPFAFVILIFMILGVLFVLFYKEFRVRNLAAVFLICGVVFGISLGIYTKMGEDETYLYLQTDGKNDMLGVVDDGEVLLMDVTSGGQRMPEKAVETIADYYRCEIDTYLVTHLHAYHAGTLKRLTEEIKIHRILLPEAETEQDTRYLQDIMNALDGVCEIVLYPRDGSVFAEVGETVLRLPKYETISRSTHPLISVSARTAHTDAWIYCGASSMEDMELWEEVRAYRTVIFGAHGPKVKNLFDSDCLWNTELVVFASAETKALVDSDDIYGKSVTVTDEYHICFEH